MRLPIRRRRSLLGWPRRRGLAALALVLVFVSCPASAPALASESPAPLVGFSFVPGAATAQGQDPAKLLGLLLDRLDPDLVRLPVSWADVAPSPATFDFAATDSLLAVIARRNAEPAVRHTRVILVVGARNLGYPELYVPGWVEPGRLGDVATLLNSADYRRYVRSTVRRYATEPLLFAWQVENEPLDQVTSGAPGPIARDPGDVAAEVAWFSRLDPHHRAVVTTYTSATIGLDLAGSNPANPEHSAAVGHPSQVLGLAGVLGLDLYVVTPSTPLRQTAASTRISWKRDGLGYWSDRAQAQGKEVWVMEMQGASWQGTSGFTRDDLISSALAYRDSGARVILAWGVEQWATDTAWMDAGVAATHLVRGEDPGDLTRIGAIGR